MCVNDFAKVVTYETHAVGVWDTITEKLTINDDQIVWNVFEDGDDRATPRRRVPVFQCGRRCGPGEVYSYFKVAYLLIS